MAFDIANKFSALQTNSNLARVEPDVYGSSGISYVGSVMRLTFEARYVRQLSKWKRKRMCP
jgi:hypothetical protein